ncbi:DUF535 family protein [Paracoccus caeni]|uniref:DUF535 family protein n=1 Tax=Paracoccus caeni TaxID=657651 RepID=A0A934SHU1_9RHOB|nr:DUF535 family protein [Paracoccus caeni]MBK4218112.1 DUF535 family protein [Paracoccus caeni]
MMSAAGARLLGRAMPRIAERGNLRLRLRVLASALRHRGRVTAIAAAPSPALRQIADERPEVLLGPLVWPYLCAGWTADECLDRLRAHYRMLDRLGPPFPFSADERLVLAELDDIHPGLRVVLDQPQWFMREGGLTLNLFVDDFRAYSLAFSFSETSSGDPACLIGAIQGRNTDEAEELYRDLTKAAHGLRPRDLLIEICRILCRHWNIGNLLAVRDSERHHRHPYFGGKKIAPQDYDAIWQDRGGHLEDAHFYRLPISPERRDEAEMKPNKRSLYRRRYRFLDRLEADIPDMLPRLQPVRFSDR